MQLIVEAEGGLVSGRPDLLVDALLAIALSEGSTEDEFLAAIAKAAGASKAHQHASERSRYLVVDACAAEAKRVYGVAMTVALNEIAEMLREHLATIDVGELRSG